MKEQITFSKCFGLFWKNTFNFKGCASRTEYWYSILWVFLITLPVTIMGTFSFLFYISGVFEVSAFFIWLALTIVAIVLALVLFLPMFSLLIRRFHDCGKSMLLPLVYLIMSIICFNLPDLHRLFIRHTGITIIDLVSNLLGLAFIPLTWMLGIYLLIVTMLPGSVQGNKYKRPIQVSNGVLEEV